MSGTSNIASLINGGLHIPAGASDYRVDAEMTINQDVTMWSMLPHTHVRGTRWTYEAIYPDAEADGRENRQCAAEAGADERHGAPQGRFEFLAELVEHPRHRQPREVGQVGRLAGAALGGQVAELTGEFILRAIEGVAIERACRGVHPDGRRRG